MVRLRKTNNQWNQLGEMKAQPIGSVLTEHYSSWALKKKTNNRVSPDREAHQIQPLLIRANRVHCKKVCPFPVPSRDVTHQSLHRKQKIREFPVPSRDVTTKLSLGGNNDVITELFLPRGSLVSDIPAGDGKLVNLFLRCRVPGRVW